MVIGMGRFLFDAWFQGTIEKYRGRSSPPPGNKIQRHDPIPTPLPLGGMALSLGGKIDKFSMSTHH